MFKGPLFWDLFLGWGSFRGKSMLRAADGRHFVCIQWHWFWTCFYRCNLVIFYILQNYAAEEMLSLAYNNIFDQVFLGTILNNYWLCQLSLLLVFFSFPRASRIRCSQTRIIRINSSVWAYVGHIWGCHFVFFFESLRIRYIIMIMKLLSLFVFIFFVWTKVSGLSCCSLVGNPKIITLLQCIGIFSSEFYLNQLLKKQLYRNCVKSVSFIFLIFCFCNRQLLRNTNKQSRMMTLTCQIQKIKINIILKDGLVA